MEAQAIDRLARARHQVDQSFIGLSIYAALASVWMLAGFGGPVVMHYLGLVSDLPANLCSAALLGLTAWHIPRGPARTAWQMLCITLAIYFVGSTVAALSWFRGVDPFPGLADIFFCAFCLTTFITACLLIRAAAVRVSWLQLCLDAAIFTVGFGAFFWYLVIRPAALQAPIDSLKQLLSQGYAAMDCVLLLMLGVVLLTDAHRATERRISLYIMLGFSTIFLGDILWSLAKLRGYYLPGGLQDVAYLVCYVPFAAAARAKLRALQTPAVEVPASSDAMSRALPYSAMLVSLLVLVYLTRGEIAGPATAMTLVVFALMLLLMIRQSVILKGEAAARELRAARLVEQRFESLIANASDVIVVVAPDGVVRFASPAARRTFGIDPDSLLGRDISTLWAGEDGDRWAKFLNEVNGAATGTARPHRDPYRARRGAACVGVRRQQLERRSGGGGLVLELPRHQRSQGAGGEAAQAGVPRSAHPAREPQPVPRPGPACPGAGAGQRLSGRGAVSGPGQFQEHQRFARPRCRRPAAAGGRAAHRQAHPA